MRLGVGDGVAVGLSWLSTDRDEVPTGLFSLSCFSLRGGISAGVGVGFSTGLRCTGLITVFAGVSDGVGVGLGLCLSSTALAAIANVIDIARMRLTATISLRITDDTS